jgi:hypothetical protein
LKPEVFDTNNNKNHLQQLQNSPRVEKPLLAKVLAEKRKKSERKA